jgi:Protein of unknown function (DUF2442)
MNTYVKRFLPMDDYRLEVVFENDERRMFEVKPYLQRCVFVHLQNRAVFRAARVVAGSVEWPGGVDLSYDALYLEGQPVTAPVIMQVAGETAP